MVEEVLEALVEVVETVETVETDTGRCLPERLETEAMAERAAMAQAVATEEMAAITVAPVAQGAAEAPEPTANPEAPEQPPIRQWGQKELEAQEVLVEPGARPVQEVLVEPGVLGNISPLMSSRNRKLYQAGRLERLERMERLQV